MSSSLCSSFLRYPSTTVNFSLFWSQLSPKLLHLHHCSDPFSSSSHLHSCAQLSRPCLPTAPSARHHSELGILWNPHLIRANKYCKARTQAGSPAKARYYFGWTVPLSVDWGRLTAWGRGWRVTERRNDVLWGHRTATHAPALYPPSSSSDHSEGPLSPFSVLNSWQSHSETCAKEGAGGALLCNSAFPNRSSILLKM